MTVRAVRVENFKCFRELRLPLAALTLVTGYNAAGKSTALQGLLLLAQASRHGSSAGSVPLAGPLVRLGLPGDVLSANVDSRVIRLQIETEHEAALWELEPEQLSIGLLKVRSGVITPQSGQPLRWQGTLWPEVNSTYHYEHMGQLQRTVSETILISAVRAGTSDAFPVPDDAGRVHADVGVHGEFAPWWFARMADDEVDKLRRHPGEPGTSLRRQLAAYLNELFPGGEANADHLVRAGVVHLELRTSIASDWRRPANIGYGLTYGFPILTALLTARVGQIVMIDSPEAHLHPRAQSAMGRMLARFANAGVQILVETHSDHVLNGVRLAVRHGTIPADELAIRFFAGAAGGEHGVSALSVDAQGAIDVWPEGFFDQSERDLTQLAGWA